MYQCVASMIDVKMDFHSTAGKIKMLGSEILFAAHNSSQWVVCVVGGGGGLWTDSPLQAAPQLFFSAVKLQQHFGPWVPSEGRLCSAHLLEWTFDLIWH